MTGRDLRRIVVRAPGEHRGKSVSGTVRRDGQLVGIRRDGAPAWYAPATAIAAARALRKALPAGCTVTVQRVVDD